MEMYTCGATPGQLMDHRMKEVHLFIPTDDFELPAKQGKNAIKPCYLDVKSGFINFMDDSSAGKSWIRKLYYCNYSAKRQAADHYLSRPARIAGINFLHRSLPHSALGVISLFFNLIKSQFQLQPAVPGKDSDPVRFPNEDARFCFSLIAVNVQQNWLEICLMLPTFLLQGKVICNSDQNNGRANSRAIHEYAVRLFLPCSWSASCADVPCR